jgi:C4-dicarboxylate-specific signal transduction histidine kinase
VLVPADDRECNAASDCNEDSCPVAHELELRIREFNCLLGISKLVEHGEGDLDAILQGAVELLPSSWERPETACARISLDGQTYVSTNFEAGGSRQSVDLRVNREMAGYVEVRYLDGHCLKNPHPFLPSEHQLLQAVAERLGHVVERIRAQESLRQRDLEIREDQAHLTRMVVMGEMASMIAHEVNQPLTAIANYAHACHRLIYSKLIGESETLSTLTRIGKEAIRAGAIIHSLKDLSQKRKTKREESDINRVILDIEPLMQVDARMRDVRLQLELAETPPTVMVDRVQIQQVIINLVRNAFDAMVETPRELREVVISTRESVHGDVEVHVADHGCGITLGDNERMYETFFTTKDTGMGMGLSVSRTIVATHGGHLSFTDNPGGGTIFHLSFPPAAGGKHET